MFEISSPTGSSIISQSRDVADEDKVGDNKFGGNETTLSNSSALKKSIGAGYLTSEGAKKGGGNTKQGVKAAIGLNYLNPAAK